MIDQIRDEQTHLIVEQLQTQQYLRPHQTVCEALDRAQSVIGFCPAAADHAVRRLDIDPQSKVGRMRRTELLQLARCLQRAWSAASPQSLAS